VKRRRPPEAVVGVDHLIRNIEHGRFERALAGLTAGAAVVTGAEIFLEHDRASFGNRMMWVPVALTPLVAGAAAAGVFRSVVSGRAPWRWRATPSRRRASC
jgi:hypothetical protein